MRGRRVPKDSASVAGQRYREDWSSYFKSKYYIQRGIKRRAKDRMTSNKYNKMKQAARTAYRQWRNAEKMYGSRSAKFQAARKKYIKAWDLVVKTNRYYAFQERF